MRALTINLFEKVFHQSIISEFGIASTFVGGGGLALNTFWKELFICLYINIYMFVCTHKQIYVNIYIFTCQADIAERARAACIAVDSTEHNGICTCHVTQRARPLRGICGGHAFTLMGADGGGSG